MKDPRKKTKRQPRRFPATEKCRAVLSLWTEQRSASALCRELGVSWNQLNQWQEQAMEGMLQALAPQRPVSNGQISLNTRLQSLLDRKTVRANLPKVPPSTPAAPSIPIRHPPNPSAPAKPDPKA